MQLAKLEKDQFSQQDEMFKGSQAIALVSAEIGKLVARQEGLQQQIDVLDEKKASVQNFSVLDRLVKQKHEQIEAGFRKLEDETASVIETTKQHCDVVKDALISYNETFIDQMREHSVESKRIHEMTKTEVVDMRESLQSQQKNTEVLQQRTQKAIDANLKTIAKLQVQLEQSETKRKKDKATLEGAVQKLAGVCEKVWGRKYYNC
jgi:hypothetical protein